MRKKIYHIEKKLCLYCYNQIVHKLKHIPYSKLMSSNSGLFSIWHILSSLITDQKRNFSLAGCSFFAYYSHFFHVKIHTNLNFIFKHIEYLSFNSFYFFDSFAFLILCIEMKIIDRHSIDCLTIKSFNVFNFSAYPSAFDYSFFDMMIA